MPTNHAQIKRHILIVDDEPAVRRTVRGVLESSGFACAESENGASALEWLESHHVDVIIIDYQMPIMDGLKLLVGYLEPPARLRATPSLARSPRCSLAGCPVLWANS